MTKQLANEHLEFGKDFFSLITVRRQTKFSPWERTNSSVGVFVIRKFDNSVLVWFRHVAKSLLKKKCEFPFVFDCKFSFFSIRQWRLYICRIE